jgi:hypothetical protein
MKDKQARLDIAGLSNRLGLPYNCWTDTPATGVFELIQELYNYLGVTRVTHEAFSGLVRAPSDQKLKHKRGAK